MKHSGPIGFFDSGVGGTSIWKEVIHLLPKENTVYLADSRNAPYGERPEAEIIELSRKNTEKLLEMGCKLIVVACNTATTNAISFLRANYNIPFIGIEPAIKPAAIKTASKSVGILATKGTLTSALFSKTSGLYSKDIRITEITGQGLVEIIERGEQEAPETEQLLRELLRPMMEASVDYLVLGCSHYPYLLPSLRKILPEEVFIIDSGEAVARQTRAVLINEDLLNQTENTPVHRLYSNADPKVLSRLVNAAESVYDVNYLEF